MVAKTLKPDYGSVPNDFDPDEIPGIEIHYMNEEEGRAFFDAEARKTLGISGDEFLRRWDAGEWQLIPDFGEGRKIAELAMSISFARRSSR